MYITTFDFELSNTIEFHAKKSGDTFELAKATKLRLYAPSFKHRECCGKIRDVMERSGAVESGLANYNDNMVSDLYNVFYSLFTNLELIKVIINGKEHDIDSDFIDKILDFDIEKIMQKYIQVFFLQSTQEKN